METIMRHIFKEIACLQIALLGGLARKKSESERFAEMDNKHRHFERPTNISASRSSKSQESSHRK